MIILRSLEFDTGAVTVGAGLIEIGARLALFNFQLFRAAAFAGFTFLIIILFTRQDMESVLFFAAARRRAGVILSLKVADVAAGAVAIFAFDGKRFRTGLR